MTGPAIGVGSVTQHGDRMLDRVGATLAAVGVPATALAAEAATRAAATAEHLEPFEREHRGRHHPVRAHMHTRTHHQADRRARSPRFDDHGNARHRHRLPRVCRPRPRRHRPTLRWRQVGRCELKAMDRQAKLAVGQPSHGGGVRVWRPPQRTGSWRRRQQPQAAVGWRMSMRHPTGLRPGHGPRAGHSRVTPGRCPTSWPSTYNAPSGAPASA